ncbi:hypothetical protein M2163_006232 [Streptomyces sp. SAI-135]|jgi:hypothetical protein|uniref:hypothetical protein n=1 Tax=unclassified Streptomyces TaxID=2593676 RepID=UPI00247579EB|nr:MULTISPECIES: hypothetical protein [unclassified Streptomyces]MDH6516787.1 hypothetical protein [Streptomyces sp. SAI-090]MDH6586981.1 hypothetical protein [Streptomyces sp. SAI-133]MDH6619124.1 hypothetical protein [Streptomyces sp. SAI-135]
MKSVVVVATSAVVVAGCLVGGFLVGRAFPDSERDHLDSRDICAGDDFQMQVAAFERILPQGRNVASSATSRSTDIADELNSTCRISVDGENAFHLESQTVTMSADTWEKSLLADGVVTKAGLKTFTAGTRALSSPNAAAIYLACTRRDAQGRSMALSIDVSAQGPAVSKTGAHRTDLAEIAVQAARVVTLPTQCKSTDPLPEGALPALK